MENPHKTSLILQRHEIDHDATIRTIYEPPQRRHERTKSSDELVPRTRDPILYTRRRRPQAHQPIPIRHPQRHQVPRQVRNIPIEDVIARPDERVGQRPVLGIIHHARRMQLQLPVRALVRHGRPAEVHDVRLEKRHVVDDERAGAVGGRQRRVAHGPAPAQAVGLVGPVAEIVAGARAGDVGVVQVHAPGAADVAGPVVGVDHGAVVVVVAVALHLFGGLQRAEGTVLPRGRSLDWFGGDDEGALADLLVDAVDCCFLGVDGAQAVRSLEAELAAFVLGLHLVEVEIGGGGTGSSFDGIV